MEEILRNACLLELQGHGNRVRAVAFSSDGKTIVSGSEDQTIRLWDVGRGLRSASHCRIGGSARPASEKQSTPPALRERWGKATEAVSLLGTLCPLGNHEKLLLSLSHHAVMSSWVQQEVGATLHKEITTKQEILFPIRLDNTVLESDTLWAKRLRQRHIGDFTNWQDDVAYQDAFTTLLRHLKVAKTPTV